MRVYFVIVLKCSRGSSAVSRLFRTTLLVCYALLHSVGTIVSRVYKNSVKIITLRVVRFISCDLFPYIL